MLNCTNTKYQNILWLSKTTMEALNLMDLDLLGPAKAETLLPRLHKSSFIFLIAQLLAQREEVLILNPWRHLEYHR